MSQLGTKASENPRFPTKFSQPWMMDWVNAAAVTQSLKMLNEAVGITMWDYHQGRMLDPDFDAAALIYDQILDLIVLSSVRDNAIEGDARAQVLYFARVRIPAFCPAFPSWLAPKRRRDDDDNSATTSAMVTPIEPRLAEIMVDAGLRALRKRPKRRGRDGDGDGDGDPLPRVEHGRETRRRTTPTSS